MKTPVRLMTAAALLASAFALIGCSTRTAVRPQVQVVEEFSVVESSTSQELTPAQLAELRRAVFKYLREQGLADNGVYYVRVTFPSASPDGDPEWAIVRVGHLGTRTFTVLAAYPGADDFYPYDYHRTSYYGSYGGFSRWGYYDPFDYNYGYPTGRPGPPRDHGRPDKPDYKPGDKPKPPHGTPTRWDRYPRNQPDNERRDHPPRRDGPGRWDRDRTGGGGGYSRPDAGSGRSYSPPPERHSTPPPERSYSPPPPPPPPSPATMERVESSNSGIQQATSTEKER